MWHFVIFYVLTLLTLILTIHKCQHALHINGNPIYEDKHSMSTMNEDVLISSIVSRSMVGKMLHSTDNDVHIANRIISLRPRVDMSFAVSCTSNHLQYFDQMYLSLVLQTVHPDEIIFVFSTQNEAENIQLPQILTVLPLPQAKVYVRQGIYWPYENRVFMMHKSRRKLLSLFDCDDFMHPQRLEYLHEVFSSHPDVDAVIHGGLFDTGPKKLANEYRQAIYRNYSIPKRQMMSWRNKWTKDILFDACSHEKRRYCDVNDLMRTERLKPKAKYKLLHGWITMRDKVKKVKYPQIQIGEDVSFNTQIIRNNFTFAIIDEPLGVYTLPSGGGMSVNKTKKDYERQ